MKEYTVLHDTIVRGRHIGAGKTMMLTPEKAAGYVKGGLIIETATPVAAQKADEKTKAKGEASKADKPEEAVKAA